MSYPEEYFEVHNYPLDGPLGKTSRLSDIWRNSAQQFLVSHVATIEEAAFTIDAMDLELNQWTTRLRRMEQQMRKWQNDESHAKNELKTLA